MLEKINDLTLLIGILGVGVSLMMIISPISY